MLDMPKAAKNVRCLAFVEDAGDVCWGLDVLRLYAGSAWDAKVGQEYQKSWTSRESIRI